MADPNTILTSIGTTLITNLVSDKNSGPFRTLNDVWDYSIGSLIHSIAEKKRVKHAFDVEAYKKQLEKEVLSIPPDNLIEPPLNIIGPALEASKYYIEEEALRSMFAKLVASSMDDRKSDHVHPAFIELIKQLSPLDAEIIDSFNKQSLHPIVNYGVRDSNDGSFRVMIGNVFLIGNVYLNNKKGFDNMDKQLNSIANLHRLGLVTIQYDFSIGDHWYIEYEEHESYRDFCDSITEEEEFFGGSVDIQKGGVRLSTLGLSFVATVSGE
ncbi:MULTISPECIES: DUF4393 domain-containing protein [Bacillaceae]|uniref:DUF4393 domain-containing protein n=1 Tax=Bacillaceae TaxID=186817 RepID=UPI002FFFB126